ncbi:hypothetical protein BOTBODRAFT_177865 [Botryobasidium botryosum FD-172 SS1]|uniref:Uncharacterized protein n=1 Tax=Botryobasidium botryosum (strain FD-172 SS1) TaxID=930990 RepID=A0A067MFY6_BOTB1|nr:hypothetical protein BOTBODRAFT_177865 [Botryobasidium botryosum FD-172 SS1]
MKSAIMLLFSLHTLLASATAIGKRDSFANFFDDAACTVNGGIGVDIYNTGCLAEGGRRSVYIPRSTFFPTDQMCLVKTKRDGSCSYQSEGFNFTPTGFCAVLDPSVQSYRFISVSFLPHSSILPELTRSRNAGALRS